MDSITTAATALSATAQSVFAVLAKRRRARFRSIADQLAGGGSKPAREELLRAVEELKSKGFVREKSAPIDDWKTLYLSADGLRAVRKHAV